MNSFKDPKVLIALVVIGSTFFLGWNYINAINLRNEIDQQKILSEEKIKLEEIEQEKQAALIRAQTEKETKNLQAAQAEKNRIDDKKQTCSKDADALYYKEYQVSNSTFSVHYNTDLDTCFMRVDGVGTEYVSTQLVDVDERKNVGFCNQSRTTGDVQVCFIRDSGCSAYRECMDLIEPLMKK